MPINPLDALKSLHLGESRQLSPEEQVQQDAAAEQAQAGDPAWKKLGRGAVDGVVGFTKGLTGLGDQGPAGASATNLGQLVSAGLPFLNKGGLIEALRGAAPAGEASQFFTPANYAADNAFMRARGGEIAPGMHNMAHELPQSQAFKGLQDTIQRSNLGLIAEPGMLSPAAARAASQSAADVFNPAVMHNMENMYHEAKPAFQGLEAAGAFGGDRSVGGLHQPGTGVMSGRPDLVAVGDEGLFNAARPQAGGAADPVQSAYRALLQRGGR